MKEIGVAESTRKLTSHTTEPVSFALHSKLWKPQCTEELTNSLSPSLSLVVAFISSFGLSPPMTDVIQKEKPHRHCPVKSTTGSQNKMEVESGRLYQKRKGIVREFFQAGLNTKLRCTHIYIYI